MLGMSRKLKYIKVVGTVTDIGGYRTVSRGQRPYEAVTIRDEANGELNFRLLRVPVRLDAKIARGEPATFYICRAKSKGKLIGVLYALEAAGKKHFFADESAEAIKEFAKDRSLRATVFTNPIGAVAGFLAGAAPVAVMGPGVLPFAALWWAWVLYPFVLPNAYAGLAAMRRTVQRAGFDAEPPALATTR